MPSPRRFPSEMSIPIYERQKIFFRQAYEAGETPWPRFKPTPAVMRLARRLRRERGRARVLDVGCGEGRHLICFGKEGHRAVGVDYESLALGKACARQDALAVRPRLTFVLADAFRLPFRQESFDALVDCGCFHHVKKADWSRYRNGLAALLKPGGYFHLTAFSTRFKHYPGERRTRNWVVHRNHYDHFFRKSDFTRVFGKTFEILKIEEERQGLHAFWHVLMKKR
ncbi:MAG: class I SAM-dependent methyltransferase [candidate division NC10 bacterium]|nr:class I SAM-dependent methyltransferase [candidate division NC10 bacterium]